VEIVVEKVTWGIVVEKVYPCDRIVGDAEKSEVRVVPNETQEGVVVSAWSGGLPRLFMLWPTKAPWSWCVLASVLVIMVGEDVVVEWILATCGAV
jgi:hypothetical protein